MNTEPLIIVCGQPRSGTSMLMRIMEMGGIPVEYDVSRNVPDVLEKFNNPYGMFETNNPSYTKCFKCWNIKSATKINVLARYIYIERNIRDVINSWERVHKRNRTAPNPSPEMTSKRNLRIEKNRQEWHKFLKDKDCLKLNMEDILEDSEQQLQKLSDFIKRPFDIQKALTAIDKTI